MPNVKSASDLDPRHTVLYNKLGNGSKALVGFDLAVSGPGVIDDPAHRVMTGAMSSAQATEQTTLISTAGGQSKFVGRAVTEAGTKAN